MKKILYIIIGMIVVFSSCNKEEEITTVLPPKINLVDYDGKYTIKQGAKLTISPEYESVEDAVFSWTLEGKEIGDDRFLIYSSEETGDKVITLKVSTDYGTDKKDIRVEVVELEIPYVTLPGADKGFSISVGSEITFSPVVKNTTLPQSYTWFLDGKNVSDELVYTFKAEAKGTFSLKFSAKTDDGSHEVELSVEVLDSEDMPFTWEFEKKVFNYSKGRQIRISPRYMSRTDGVNFVWQLDGKEVQSGEKSEWICSLDEEKTYQLEVVANLTSSEGKNIVVSQHLEINVCPAEGKYKRTSNGSSAADFNEIFEYLPAPGQFINENYSALTPADAIAKAKSSLDKNSFVSLGGFGGYIIVGFDHSIENGPEYDFGVYGNAFDNSSEPGIIWVMQDENGDGKPNDTWYELKGSETGKAETIQNYSVTYFRPEAPGMNVQWKDNKGNTGTVEHLQFHTQDYYYPTWVEADSYTLYGTCLKSKNYDQSGDGSYWVQPAYDWGYADNYSAKDHISAQGKLKGKANLFDIDNAIDYEGKSIKLDYIDFIKVQNGVNTKSGWLGEMSTEVLGFFDYTVMK